MNKALFIKKLTTRAGMLIWLGASVYLIGCATHPEMSMAEKNIEEGRLVPERLLQSDNFLDRYHHRLPEPQEAPLALYITSDSRYALTQGDTAMLQIGLATRPPQIAATQLHLLAYLDEETSAATRERFAALLKALDDYKPALPTGSRLTVDWSNGARQENDQWSPLIGQREDGGLDGFLRQFLTHSFEGENHHLVLAVGEYERLSHKQKQNVLDMASVLQAKSVTLSVLATGDKPDFAFLKRLSEKGRGHLTIVGETFSYSQWLDAELRARHATALREVSIVARFKNQVSIAALKSPGHAEYGDHRLELTLPTLSQGEQRVVLAEVQIPKMSSQLTIKVVDVEVSYFDEAQARYRQTRKSYRLTYTGDRNVVLGHRDPAIERSLLILDTQRTLIDVEQAIRDRRNYQAIALLTEQSRELRSLGEASDDRELLRDAGILDKYAARLYDFDAEAFKGVKIWRDLHWDNGRFTDHYL